MGVLPLIQVLVALTFANGATVRLSALPTPSDSFCLPARVRVCQSVTPDTAHRITVTVTQGVRSVALPLTAAAARQAYYLMSAAVVRSDTVGPVSVGTARASALCDALACRVVINTFIRAGPLPKPQVQRFADALWYASGGPVRSGQSYPWVWP